MQLVPELPCQIAVDGRLLQDEEPRRPAPLHAPGKRSQLVPFRARGDYGCVWTTYARRTDGPVVSSFYADHRVGSRREESLGALSGFALRRRAPHRAGRRDSSPCTRGPRRSDKVEPERVGDGLDRSGQRRDEQGSEVVSIRLACQRSPHPRCRRRGMFSLLLMPPVWRKKKSMRSQCRRSSSASSNRRLQSTAAQESTWCFERRNACDAGCEPRNDFATLAALGR
jgi:hypothetical protein